MNTLQHQAVQHQLTYIVTVIINDYIIQKLTVSAETRASSVFKRRGYGGVALGRYILPQSFIKKKLEKKIFVLID